MRRKRTKRTIRRMIKYYAAWAIIYVIETVIAVAPTMLAAVLLLPYMQIQRGEIAYGGEWILLALVFILAFYYTDRRFMDLIYGEEE